MTDLIVEKKIALRRFGVGSVLILSLGLLAILALAGMLVHLFVFGVWPPFHLIFKEAHNPLVQIGLAAAAFIAAAAYARTLRRVWRFRSYYDYIRHLEDELRKKDGQLVRKAVLMGRMRPRALPVQVPRPDLATRPPVERGPPARGALEAEEGAGE